MKLTVFSGGAAQAVVTGLQACFEKAVNAELEPEFGAVGTMRDKMLGGAACDVIILSAALIGQLEQQGHVVAGSARPLGGVATSVAVRAGTPLVDVSTGEALKNAFGSARGLYFPHLTKSTAGIHIANVLKKLGLETAVADRVHEYPNGAAAMEALSKTTGDGMIGCTQVTEILFAPGLTLVGDLPAGYELTTVYVAALCTKAAEPALAKRFIETLSAETSHALRAEAGFQVGS
jgi:molybdate transport system substrate-binding protein